jgi:hypothetical protein
MKSAGIPDPLGRNAVRLDPATIPAEPPPGAPISLKAIRKLVNVNALEHPDGISLETEGLTIIYGDIVTRAKQLEGHRVALVPQAK